MARFTGKLSGNHQRFGLRKDGKHGRRKYKGAGEGRRQQAAGRRLLFESSLRGLGCGCLSVRHAMDDALQLVGDRFRQGLGGMIVQ